jgi:hypothetical protein
MMGVVNVLEKLVSTLESMRAGKRYMMCLRMRLVSHPALRRGKYDDENKILSLTVFDVLNFKLCTIFLYIYSYKEYIERSN